MANLQDLISQYPILTNLASQLSALDLYHLAATSRANHASIRSSHQVFETLKRTCLCDGHGLRDRHNFAGLYALDPRRHVCGAGRRLYQDEPIEVRLFNIECDEAGALPCLKCGINVCEECRYYPREAPLDGYPERRPHLNSPFSLENVMCLCPQCDAKMQYDLEGQFLNELCDCDVYTRWICQKSVKEERKFTREYYHEHTIFDPYYDEDWGVAGRTKEMVDHHFTRGV